MGSRKFRYGFCNGPTQCLSVETGTKCEPSVADSQPKIKTFLNFLGDDVAKGITRGSQKGRVRVSGHSLVSLDGQSRTSDLFKIYYIFTHTEPRSQI